MNAHQEKAPDLEHLLKTGRYDLCSKTCFKILSMRNIVVFILTAMVIVSSLGVLLTNVVSGYVVVDSFVSELRDQIQAGVKGKLELLLLNPQLEVKRMADWYNSGELDLYNTTALARKITYGGIVGRPEFATYFYAFGEENAIQGFHRPKVGAAALDGSFWHLYLPPNKKTDTNLKYYFVDSLGRPNLTHVMSIQQNFYVEKRAYYKAVMAHPDMDAVFGAPYIGGQPFSVLFPCASKIMDYSVSPPKIMGAAVINYASYTLQDFFKTIKFGKHGTVYLMSDDGSLLAANDDKVPGWLNINNAVSFLNATNATEWNPFIGGSAIYLFTHGDLRQSNIFRTFIAGEEVLIDHQILPLPGINLHMVVIVAYSDFNTQYIRNLIISVIISVVLVLLSLIIGLIVSIISTQRLNKISKLMSHAADMNLDNITLSAKHLSWIMELRQIEMSFFWMVKNLKEYKTFLPANLFSQLPPEEEAPEASTAVAPAPDSRPGSTNTSSMFNRAKVRPGKSLAESFAASFKSGMNKFEIGITQQEVAVMHIKFENFSSLASKLTPQELVEAHTQFINTVHKFVRAKRGSIERFVGNVVTCTFNSAVPCMNFVSNCCTAACEIRDAISLYNAVETHHAKIALSIGISTGTASCGNMGSDAIRCFTTVGTVIKRSHLLMTLCSVYGNTILIDCNCQARAHSSFYTVPINSINFSKFNRESIHFYDKEVIQDKECFDLYELVRIKKAKQGDEWMYEMKDNEEDRSWIEVHEAFALKKKGLFEQAKTKVLSFLKLYPKEGQKICLDSTSSNLYHFFLEDQQHQNAWI